VNAAEQREVNRIGDKHGCHHGKAHSKGQPNWTGDHQPVTKLVDLAGKDTELMKLMTGLGMPTTLGGQVLYPHCAGCWRAQGGTYAAVLGKLKKLNGMRA
jgi:hypothetical protein